VSELEPDTVDEHTAVIVYRATMLDGPVLTWFATLGAARHGRGVISASRNGVMVHGDVYLHAIPRKWMDQAEEAHADLAMGSDPPLHLAHYRRMPMLGNPDGLVPVIGAGLEPAGGGYSAVLS
jgi:hypothetical protein